MDEDNYDEEEELFPPFPGDGPRNDDWVPAPYKKSLLCPRNRLYLYDRTRGASRYRGFHDRPINCICFVPVPIYVLSPFCEQNSCCEIVGSVGCVDPEDQVSRKRLMTMGFITNSISLILMILSCCVIAKNHYGLVEAFPFSRGTVTNVNTKEKLLTINIGLRAVAFETHVPLLYRNATGKRLSQWDDMCSEVDDIIFRPEYRCEQCAEKSSPFVINVLMSTLTCFPSLTTNYLRMFANYDINCQKAFGWLITIFAVVSTLRALMLYHNACTANFSSGELSFFADGTPVPDGYGGDEQITTIAFEWQPGSAFICMIVATVIRTIDALVSGILPTPSITRSRKEQDAYEARYLKASTKPLETDETEGA